MNLAMPPTGPTDQSPRLIIHAGTHKTATTPFQLLCARNRGNLSKAGVLYPVITTEQYEKAYICPQHSGYARDLSRLTPKLTKQHFQQYIKTAADKNLHTLFLSGEDFENILLDDILVNRILQLCEELKFKKPIFIFTTRNPYDYFCSLYHELSKKRMHVDFKQAALAAAATGYLAFPTPSSLSKNLTFNSFFAIDADNLIFTLQKKTPKFKGIQNDVRKFHKPQSGRKIYFKIL